MDKQKQIEEMAKDMYDSHIEICDTISFDDCPRNCNVCNSKALYERGYRKIPENAVVLTGTEAEERFVDLLTEFDEMSFYPLSTCGNAEKYTKDWKRRMLYAIGQLRKEMAEKFAKKAKDLFDERYRKCGMYVESTLDKNDIDEICKEITEGK